MATKTMPNIAEARQSAVDALMDAYGRTQTTPDGIYCRFGRIDRAYKMKAQKQGGEKYQAAIKEMEDSANQAFAKADAAMASYARLRKMEGLENDLDAPSCDCPYCQQTPTFGGQRL